MHNPESLLPPSMRDTGNNAKIRRCLWGIYTCAWGGRQEPGGRTCMILAGLYHHLQGTQGTMLKLGVGSEAWCCHNCA